MNINRLKIKYLCKKKKASQQITSTQEDEAGGLLQVQGQPELHGCMLKLIIMEKINKNDILFPHPLTY